MIVRFISISIGIVFLLTLSGFIGVYFASERQLRDVHYDALFDHPIPGDAASIAAGRYVARTRGCFGCHGQQLEGKDFDQQWDWPARAVAPNLARLAREHDAVALEAAIRQGIGINGKALVSMPSYNFARLSDQDTARLIAFLRAAPVVEHALPRPRLGWCARWDLGFGGESLYKDWADAVPRLQIDPATDPELAHGEYLAMTMCNECHGLDVRGQSLFPPATPDLAIVAGVDRQAFERIVRTGKGFGGRDLGLMSLVAPDRFAALSEQDVDALYLYLSSLPARPPLQDVFWRPST